MFSVFGRWVLFLVLGCFGCVLGFVWLWLIVMVMRCPGVDFGGLDLYVNYVFVFVDLVCCVG